MKYHIVIFYRLRGFIIDEWPIVTIKNSLHMSPLDGKNKRKKTFLGRQWSNINVIVIKMLMFNVTNIMFIVCKILSPLLIKNVEIWSIVCNFIIMKLWSRINIIVTAVTAKISDFYLLLKIILLLWFLQYHLCELQ